MLKTEIDNRVINVKWHYDHSDGIVTTCVISDDTEEGNIIPLSSGTTRKSDNDIHCKEKARKLSLGRALLRTNLTKEERKQIWDTYLTRKEKTEEIRGHVI